LEDPPYLRGEGLGPAQEDVPLIEVGDQRVDHRLVESPGEAGPGFSWPDLEPELAVKLAAMANDKIAAVVTTHPTECEEHRGLARKGAGRGPGEGAGNRSSVRQLRCCRHKISQRRRSKHDAADLRPNVSRRGSRQSRRHGR